MNIGLDVGCSTVKAISGQRRVTFPSVVGTPDQARFSLSGADGEDTILEEPDYALVGMGAVIQPHHLKRREDRGWIESAEWYHLALAAMTELTAVTSVDLRIVTGLPVAFYADKDRVGDRLLGEQRATRDGRRAKSSRVIDSRVIIQPFGTLLLLLELLVFITLWLALMVFAAIYYSSLDDARALVQQLSALQS